MPYDDIVLEAEDKMEKALGVLADELKGVRTGRASASLVDGIKVDYYGAPTPIKSLASITVPGNSARSRRTACRCSPPRSTTTFPSSRAN